MKILFTGSSGPKVGATVAAHLAQHHHIVGIDLLPAATTTHIADIANITDWSPYLDGVDAVVHFAALHAPHRETHSRENFYATNVEATARLLNAAKSAGVKRFVMASTTSVYGRAMRSTTTAVWVTEALSPISEDIYDETKLAAESLCRDAFSHDFITTALRFSRSFPEPQPLMALYRLYRGVDARDVAQAFLLALTAPLTQFEAFNISGDTPFAQNDCEALTHDAPSVLQQRAPQLVAEFDKRGWMLPQSIDRVYVIEKANAMLGFQPQYDWQSVLASRDH
jgi:UDP-glucose 4-epimerase